MSPTDDPLAGLRSRIDVALARELDRLLPPLEAVHASLAPVARELRAFVDGGKRIRPALLLLGYQAAGGDDLDAVLPAAIALELLHTCALVHDDIIDRAATRRGQPAVHHAFADLHRETALGGDADLYGEAAAILVGDLALVQADELFLRAEVAPERLLAAFSRFTTCREEVMVGQFLDLHAAATRTADRDLVLRVATLKSGRYSVARPLEIGAELAGAPRELLDGLLAFGDPLGRAFQLRDDLLGVFGDQDVTGKSVASDLAEGKRTLLVVEALERLDEPGRRRLEEGLGDPGLDESGADELRALLEHSGAREAAEALVTTWIDEAIRVLDGLPIDVGAADVLRRAAGWLGARNA